MMEIIILVDKVLKRLLSKFNNISWSMSHKSYIIPNFSYIHNYSRSSSDSSKNTIRGRGV